MTVVTAPFLYFEDLDPEVTYQSAARTITQADILTFAGFSGDFNPIHVDHEFAKTTPYRRPVRVFDPGLPAPGAGCGCGRALRARHNPC